VTATVGWLASENAISIAHGEGVGLFVRDRRSIALTPAGAVLLPDVRALLERAHSPSQPVTRIWLAIAALAADLLTQPGAGAEVGTVSPIEG
jgi:hypothetical protein